MEKNEFLAKMLLEKVVFRDAKSMVRDFSPEASKSINRLDKEGSRSNLYKYETIFVNPTPNEIMGYMTSTGAPGMRGIILPSGDIVAWYYYLNHNQAIVKLIKDENRKNFMELIKQHPELKQINQSMVGDKTHKLSSGVRMEIKNVGGLTVLVGDTYPLDKIDQKDKEIMLHMMTKAQSKNPQLNFNLDDLQSARSFKKAD